MRLRLLVAGLCLAWVACATNPVTGQHEVILMSPEREAALGREAAQQVAQEMGLVEDPALAAFVDAIGQRVAARSPRKDVRFQFHVADMAETNAFALPGGYIYVSRGLLALVRDEDELANVLAHEVGHVAARHAAQRETRALGVGLLGALGTLAAGALGGAPAAEAVGQLGQLAGASLIASYSRDQERQADEVGQKMAKAAGFDPIGMATFLGALDREGTLRLGQPRLPTFLDSHPSTPERVAASNARARTLGTRGGLAPVSARNAFVPHLTGLLVDEDPAEGVVRGTSFLHPGLDFELRFPSGWKVQNGRSAVEAQEPEGQAIAVLAAQERGTDPSLAAEHFLRANAQAIELQDHGRYDGAAVPGYRARARVALQQGAAGAELFWLAQAGTVYRLQCLAGTQAFGGFVRSFERTAASFRPLTAEERASIHERRLEVLMAGAGESLEALARRGGNVWPLEQVALANGLEPGAKLAAGQRVKIAVEKPYRARSE
jgi:predicted Zn-dependent protease